MAIGLSRFTVGLFSGLRNSWFKGDNMPPTTAEWPWTHFSRGEMTCKCGCGCADMDPDFMDLLERLRFECGDLPMTINSGYRCPDHNERASTSGRDGAHTTGRAVDIACSGKRQEQIQKVAKSLGCTGFGNEHGFLHIDNLTVADGPKWRVRPNSWKY
ncbi:MAG: DUF882 domain-containing protein [Magnetococcales bacterium]|nr:DUF882 domain-containing protein [Magnetococcales bacterium]